MYSFNRRLQQADWDIILGYTRRIQRLPRLHHDCDLTTDCFKELSEPPSSIAIFPKLRYLALHSPWKPIACFVPQFINPGLTHLSFYNAKRLGSIHAFGNGCPNVKWFHVAGMEPWADPGMISGFICQWPNLHYVDCLEVELSVAAFVRLSCLHSLNHLHFQLHDEVVNWIQSCQSGTFVLTFATLRTLSLNSESLASTWMFLRHLRLPVIEDLAIRPYVMPTAPDIMSFLAGLQATCTHDTLHHFTLLQRGHYDFDEDPTRYHITFVHLHSLTVFTKIRSITIDPHCSVVLTERELLCLAASWPCLERFIVHGTPRRTELSGITPGGFVQLLERWRSLRTLHVNFDVRGYTEPPQGHPWHGLRMQERARLHLQNSPIEEESVYALGVFFHVAPYPDFQLDTHQDYLDVVDDETPEELCNMYHDRWKRVHALARELWEERRALKRSLSAPFFDNDVL